jgi:hypothetical protein
MKRTDKWMACALLAACLPIAAHAAEPRSYASDLATLYNEHQRVLAMREACVAGQPALRNEVEGAYKDWHDRHALLVDDLENRFAALIKRASKDQADFSRNYGKYQSEVLALREENKRSLLAGDKEKFSAECREFPAYLRNARSNIPAMFPAEYRNIRSAR